jgi:polyferredoxin/uncharacterized protein with FMN-binding domain
MKKHAVFCIRTLSRIFFFIAFPSLYISAYFGIIDILILLRDGSFSFEAAWPSLVALSSILPITIIGSRFFCGFMCAFGAFTDVFYQIGYRISRKKFRIPKRMDAIFRYVKYLILVLLITLTWASVSVAEYSPWDAFGMLFTTGGVPNFSLVIRAALPGTIILIVVLAASVFIERFFCRYLCPIGSVFAAVSSGRLARIEKPGDNCGKCQVCTRACPMGIDLSSMDVVKSVECIHCMRCVEACPRKNTRLAILRRKTPEMLAAIIALLLITGLYLTLSWISETGQNADTAAGVSDETRLEISDYDETRTDVRVTDKSLISSDTSASEWEQSTAVNVSEESSKLSETADTFLQQPQYLDGTYQGKGEGFRGEVTIELTIFEGKIADIVVVSYEDDDKYFERAARAILTDVKEMQDGNVDAVSGATYSSQGILEAIRKALLQAEPAG